MRRGHNRGVHGRGFLAVGVSFSLLGSALSSCTTSEIIHRDEMKCFGTTYTGENLAVLRGVVSQLDTVAQGVGRIVVDRLDSDQAGTTLRNNGSDIELVGTGDGATLTLTTKPDGATIDSLSFALGNKAARTEVSYDLLSGNLDKTDQTGSAKLIAKATNNSGDWDQIDVLNPDGSNLKASIDFNGCPKFIDGSGIVATTLKDLVTNSGVVADTFFVSSRYSPKS